MIVIEGKKSLKNSVHLLETEKHEGHFYVKKLPHLPIGSFLKEGDISLFQVIGFEEKLCGAHIYTVPKLLVLQDIEERIYEVVLEEKSYSLAIITLSDKGYIGERVDTSGEMIANIIKSALPLSFVSSYILPDNPSRLKSLVSRLAYEEQYQIIISTGGTGIAPTDLTPEAILPLLSRRFHGFEQAMMAASMLKTPNALISRAFAGTLEKTFYMALQGSPKAVKENLEAVLPALPHTMAKLYGDKADCAAI